MNCCCPPGGTEAEDGVTSMRVSTGSWKKTVSVAGVDWTPRADALICVAPGVRAVASPFWSMVATTGALDCQLKMTPVNS